MPDQSPAGHAPDEAFVRGLEHRTMLKANLFAIVRVPFLAEDALSDTMLAIARSWDRYDARQPFAPWARGVARRVALANLRQAGREFLQLDDALLEEMAVELDRFGSEAEQEHARQALRGRIEKLPEANRALVQQRYFEEQSYEALATATGRSVGALYVAFARIHQALAGCVEKEMARP